jgi:ABC-type sugar transport system, periplasmic component
MRALYVSPMVYGANQAVDAISHGLEAELDAHGVEMRVAYADFDEPDWKQQADRAVRAGADAGYDAIVVWVIDPSVPADAVALRAGERRAGGQLRAAALPGRGVGRVPELQPGRVHDGAPGHPAPAGRPGGRGRRPDVIDDIELLAGIRHGLDSAGLVRVNDPEDPRYKNTTDVASGGKEKTANLLADFAQLDGLVPFNDETMLGAVEALREAGRLGEVKMVSRNGTPAAVQLIKAGIHHGTWDIDPPGIGQSVAQLVIRSAAEDLDGLCAPAPSAA